MLRKKNYRVPALEILEDRTVPATLVDAYTLTYQDIDGDMVKVQLSKPLLLPDNVNSIFAFTRSGVTGNNNTRQRLAWIDLNFPEAEDVEGLNLSVYVTKLASRSDGQAHVGGLQCLGRTLNSVNIHGDLGYYNLGGSYEAPAIQLLQAFSLGRYQITNGNYPHTSMCDGQITKLKVTGDVYGFHYYESSSYQTAVTSVDIGGSVRGEMTFQDTVDRLNVEKDVTGSIVLNGVVNNISVGGSLIGSIRHDSRPDDPIDLVYIRGNLQGGTGAFSGSFLSRSLVGSVIIGGSIQGGTGYRSGILDVRTADNISIGGSITGGRSESTGQLIVLGGAREITVCKDVMGGNGRNSGAIVLKDYSESLVETVTVQGSVIGGAGDDSGSIFGNIVDSLVIHGNVVGKTGFNSGNVTLDGIAMLLQLDGKLQGGSRERSGNIVVRNTSLSNGISEATAVITLSRGVYGGSDYASGVCSISQVLRSFTSGPIVGSTGTSTGNIYLASAEIVSINGDIRGGTGSDSGSVSIAWFTGQLTETMSIDVHGDIVGSKGNLSGMLTLGPSAAIVTIHGSVIGSEGFSSGLVEGSSIGNVEGSRFWKSLTIEGSVQGGKGYRSGFVQAMPYANPVISAGPIRIGKNLQGGSGETSGFVYVQAPLDSLTINGNIEGGTGRFSGTMQANNMGFINIGGNVRGSNGFGSGNMYVLEFVNDVSIAGHLIGGAGDFSGQLYGGLSMGDVVIGGSLIGGTAYSSGGILAENFIGSVQIGGDLIGKRVDSGFLSVIGRQGDTAINTIQIAGSIRSGQIYSTGTLGTISVAGSIIGTAALPTVIQADGSETEDGVHQTTLETLVVGKDVTFTNILLGTTALLPDGAANVGTILIGRNWQNSSLIVGFGAGADGKFGTVDDVQWNSDGASTVDSLFIAGSVLNATGTANYYMQAGEFLNVLIQNTPLPLQTGSNNDNLLLTTRTRLQERFI